MRDWTIRKLLALFLLVGVAIVSLRVLLLLFVFGGLLVFAALVVSIALFTRWRRAPSSHAAPSGPPSSSLA